MIAADTSTWIAFLHGDRAPDARLLELALADHQLIMPPVVLAELFSDPGLPDDTASLLAELPLAELTEGYWRRAGTLRSTILARGYRARLADALIAQVCLDLKLPLLTRDRGFRNFVKAAQLELLLNP